MSETEDLQGQRPEWAPLVVGVAIVVVAVVAFALRLPPFQNRSPSEEGRTVTVEKESETAVTTEGASSGFGDEGDVALKTETTTDFLEEAFPGEPFSEENIAENTEAGASINYTIQNYVTDEAPNDVGAVLRAWAEEQELSVLEEYSDGGGLFMTIESSAVSVPLLIVSVGRSGANTAWNVQLQILQKPWKKH